MAIEIQKQFGETAYFYPKVGNAGAAQTAVISIRVGEVWSLGETFEMQADSEKKYELSGQVLCPVGVYDVLVRVAAGAEGWPVLDERLFPGEFEVVPTYYDQPLYAGWNTITYGGKTLPCAECFASIMDYLIRVWHYVYPTILIYVPGDPANTLIVIEPGKEYLVEVTQDCVWRYPLP